MNKVILKNAINIYLYYPTCVSRFKSQPLTSVEGVPTGDLNLDMPNNTGSKSNKNSYILAIPFKITVLRITETFIWDIFNNHI